jgi:hypothetical protein
MAAAAAAAGVFLGGVTIFTWDNYAPSIAAVTSVCEPPNGALHHLVQLGLKDISFSCMPQMKAICGAHLCRSFTARGGDSYHYFGYVYRDSFNGLMTKFCSPDGGWPGGWDGECPEGVLIDSEKNYTKMLRGG